MITLDFGNFPVNMKDPNGLAAQIFGEFVNPGDGGFAGEGYFFWGDYTDEFNNSQLWVFGDLMVDPEYLPAEFLDFDSVISEIQVYNNADYNSAYATYRLIAYGFSITGWDAYELFETGNIAGLYSGESLYILGGGVNDTLVGGNLADEIFGYNGNDRIEGKGGNDILDGEGGKDVLIGGTGNDDFSFSGNSNFQVKAVDADKILDFTSSDWIVLEKDAFTRLTLSNVNGNQLQASQFVANTSGNATTTAHRIIYDTDDNKLYYDPDGSNLTKAKILIATFAGTSVDPVLADFWVQDSYTS